MSKKMGRPKKLADVSDETILEALGDAGGIWAHAASILRSRNIDVGRLTLRRHVEERPDLLERAREVKEAAKDFAEGILWNGVRKGNGTDVRYYLSTQARDRGFGHQVEAKITAPERTDDCPPGFINFINTLSQDELRVLHTLGMRARGKKGVMDDEMVARGLVPPRADGKNLPL